jgi:hypothetical protein
MVSVPSTAASPLRARLAAACRRVLTRLERLGQDRMAMGLLAVAGLAVLAVQILVWYPRYALEPVRPEDGYDFPIYERAAARTSAGLGPYESCAHDPAVAPHCLLYPPPFAAAISLARRASPLTFQRGTYLLILLAFWAYAAGLVKLAFGHVTVSTTLVVGAALFALPGVNVTMALGNLDMIVWALLAWGLATEAALPLVVVAAAFKLWPAVSLAVLLIAKPARIRPTAITAAALLAGTLALLGPSSFTDWFHLAVPGLRAGTLKPTNVSLVALLGRMGLPVHDPLLTLLPAAGAVGTGWLLRRQPERVRASLVGIAATVCSPIFWSKYAAVLLIPLAAWISGVVPRGRAGSGPPSAPSDI